MLKVDMSDGIFSVTFLIGIISTVVLLYWYSTRNHDYWKKRGIPYAKTYPVIGSTAENLTTPFQDIELRRYKELGRVYGEFEGNNPVLTVGEPKLIREILVKDFQIFPTRRIFATGDKVLENMMSSLSGEDWKRVRSIVSPAFSTGKLKRMMGILKDCSKTLIQNLKTDAEKGKFIDSKRMYGAFTMDVIASTAFSTKLDSHNDPDNEFVKKSKNFFNQFSMWKIIIFVTVPRLISLFKISVFVPGVTEFFKSTTLQIIEKRKRTGQTRNDFLQLLLDTAKEVAEDSTDKEGDDIASNYGEDNSGQIFKNISSKNLSMDELVAQCVLFFLAGYDTTANTISLATYLLALNPEEQDRLQREVDDALKESEGELTYECIQSMKYLDNVISETLRIYSPAIRAERLAAADYELGDTGIIIPKGMIVSIPLYAMHRDPDVFPDPLKFDPTRFTPEERAKRDQYAYLPFGAGPRNCVAMRFALMEVKTCLAHVVANFNIKRCPQTKVPLEFGMGAQQVLQPKEIILELEKRKNCYLVN